MATLRSLDFEGALRALHDLLGQSVTVTIAAAGVDPVQIVASFGGELQRTQDLGDDDTIAFVIGHGGFLVMRAASFERATLSDQGVAITTSCIHADVSRR